LFKESTTNTVSHFSPSSPEALILAIDVGSSSVRAMIFDREGGALDGVFAQVRYLPETTPDGGSMIAPDSMFGMVCECIDTVLEQAGSRAAQIEIVAMDTLVSNLMGVDAHGQPTTSIYTWADIRGAEIADEWTARLSQADLPLAEYTRRTGCRNHTSYWPLRLLWLQRHELDFFRQTAYWMSFGEFFLFCLFGERRVSLSTASWSGLFNRHRLDWDSAVLNALPIRRAQLSQPLDDPAVTLQGLSETWAKRWPALKEASWMPSVGDGVASNIGAGCTTPDRVALSVGTSGAIRVVVPGTPAQTPDGLFVYRVDSQRSLVGGPLSNAGNLYGWMLRVLNPENTPDLESAVANIEPDSHGLTILPFLAGERAPGWNDDARAVFMGMTFDTAPEHLIRAGLEAVACRFAQVARRIAPLISRDAVYIASGAAITRSPAWLQIMADVLNATVYPTEAETTIRGAVFLATGEEHSPTLGPAYTPDPVRHTIYQAAMARQQGLYERLFG
jgi:gluconokinase